MRTRERRCEPLRTGGDKGGQRSTSESMCRRGQGPARTVISGQGQAWAREDV